MGGLAMSAVLADAVSKAETFVNVFIALYGLVILVYIITSWLRLPYSVALNRIQRFLYDVSEPYLRLFRRLMPNTGPLDLSPWVATIVLWLLAWAAIHLLGLLD